MAADLHPEVTRSSFRGLLPNLWILLGLSGLAITQPILGLLGGNPEFFIASGATEIEFIGLALGVAFLPSAFLVFMELIASRISPHLGGAAHSFAVWLLAAALGLLLARHFEIEGSVATLAVAGLIASPLAMLERRWSSARSYLRLLALMPLVSTSLFLANSPAARAMWAGDPAIERGVEIGRKVSVVVLVFDELSLASLLDTDGSINAERFPNFARVVAQSHWFRDATAVSPETDRSIPSILSGLVPAIDWPPTLAQYPRNLFTLLGEQYRVTAIEPVGRLCPTTVCGAAARGFDDILTLVFDTAISYGHSVLPPTWSVRLPPIDQGWADFLGRKGRRESQARRQRKTFSRAHLRADNMRGVLERVERREAPQLVMIHTTLPHIPWQLTPSGVQYTTDWGMPGSTTKKNWIRNTDIVAQGYYRHLLQLGFVDRLLGEQVGHLEEQGLWDESLVVVTADHGVAFVPGQPRRHPNHALLFDEIYRVPLIIKLPEQRRGEVRDDPALLVDILPTIMDVLDVRTASPWQLDGRSLVGDAPPPAERPVVWYTPADRMPIGLEGLWRLVEQRSALVSHEGGWERAISPASKSRWVGRTVDSLEIAGSAHEFECDPMRLLRNVDSSSGFVPLLLHGQLYTAAGFATPKYLLVAVDGVVAGIGVPTGRDSDGLSFSAMLSEGTVVNGDNSLELFVPARAEVGSGYWKARRRSEKYELQGELQANAGSIVLPSGETLRLVGPSKAYPLVARLPPDSRPPVASGVAGSREAALLPHSVLLFASDEFVATAKMGPTHQDVMEGFAADLSYQVFQIHVPKQLLGTDPGGLKVVALFSDRAVVTEIR